MLSEHFTDSDFACHCGCGFGTNPGDVNPLLIAGLDRIWEIVGPYTLNSVCRCANHNRIVGGEPGSQHTFGNAADISGPPVDDLIKAALHVEAFVHGGIGTYHDRIHVDTRGHMARWRK